MKNESKSKRQVPMRVRSMTSDILAERSFPNRVSLGYKNFAFGSSPIQFDSPVFFEKKHDKNLTIISKSLISRDKNFEITYFETRKIFQFFPDQFP